MNVVGIRIDLQPVLESAVRDLKAATDEAVAEVMKTAAKDAPTELRNLLGYGDPSKAGEPPTNDSFELYRSIRAGQSGKREITLEFAPHAFYLDPNFKGQGKGGGYLNRPFIDKGLENAVKKLQKL